MTFEPKRRRSQDLGLSKHLPSRRDWLSGVGLGSVSALWADWLRVETALPITKPRHAHSVILIFNSGAPSHIDLWDPKPLAPDAVRGPYRAVSTSVPGIHVSELLPRMAARADKLAIVRTVYHTHSSHNSGMYWSIVGRPYPIDNTLIKPSATDFPSFGTLVGWLAQRGGYAGELPPYVITPKPHCDSFVYVTPGQFGACLGSRFDPFVVNSDPNSSEFQVPNLGLAEGMTGERFVERQALLASMEKMSRPIRSDLVADIDVNRAKAMRLVMSSQARAAFDLTREPAATRQRYGRHSWGQSHLLARRLVESGVRFVTTVNGPSISWDTHKDNFNQLENKLVPPMEQAYAALIDDLDQRGLLDTTLVVWMGDFGRTPLINKDAGRDHWPNCYSAVLAGGGIRGGQVIGESDKIGGEPAKRPVRPADIHATVFSALGYDSSAITYQTADGRPVPLSDGEPIRELL
jgi:hypothetical protein